MEEKNIFPYYGINFVKKGNTMAKVMKVQWYQPAAVSSSARRGHQMLIWRGMWSSHCSPGHMSVSETRVATSQSSSSSVCLTRAECTPLANRTRQNRWSPIQWRKLFLEDLGESLWKGKRREVTDYQNGNTGLVCVRGALQKWV
ncbi:uncharacterized protein LOC126278554 isoform X3 [Schistocerca gregaria]|uniref:uncharacterized protein LOC126278554 isoform X3 n=1 Tax=Schistocerca gregaria TaxID=7010 RepID=UPI00211EFF28|nr:uncharacterized protein LOC126278554 isoform X3 [Schistocerca gregaria]